VITNDWNVYFELTAGFENGGIWCYLIRLIVDFDCDEFGCVHLNLDVVRWKRKRRMREGGNGRERENVRRESENGKIYGMRERMGDMERGNGRTMKGGDGGKRG
jgi:hypothetical protein